MPAVSRRNKHNKRIEYIFLFVLANLAYKLEIDKEKLKPSWFVF